MLLKFSKLLHEVNDLKVNILEIVASLNEDISTKKRIAKIGRGD
jgi:hypothetical protein